ncbi:type II/IV secretion system protein [Frigidibacter sp. SD6-1]|uniref:GspE/PulE family protein n=1 Tax=Frigidibacter sp. SD6-1 TaxID=3032581 RepID=UPI0024E03619|nr:type II/IV secretion system protein [Frigidibacter sp. SD6-1]
MEKHNKYCAVGMEIATLDPKVFVDQLVERGALTQQGARRALDASLSTGTSVERTLLEIGLVAEEPLFRALAHHLGLPFVEPSEIDRSLSDRLGLTEQFLQRAAILPAYEEDETVCVATSDPGAGPTIESVAFHLRRPVSIAITVPSAVKFSTTQKDRLSQANDTEIVTEADVERLRALANDGPVIKLVNALIADAVAAGASDIHIEAEEYGARVRFRSDGQLSTIRTIAQADRAAVVSRLKVMANLNISEKRRPQDGRANVSVRGNTIDLRLSTLPTQHGESVVLRLLNRHQTLLSWRELGFDAQRVCEIRSILSLPNGVFLVAGPTGSGKTTTLYTALQELNTDDRKIVTVEDPVEYSLSGIAQVQVETAVDMTFGRALRAILRQDPDVIMIGEIRDQETAEIAVRAALVGRLVLSTVHTNDSVSAVTRLLDLGVPPYLLAATLRGVLSQRLVRRICQTCGGVGCSICRNSGRKGRTVVEELLRVTPEIADAIERRQSIDKIRELGERHGYVSMARTADAMFQRGICAKEDWLRVLGGVFPLAQPAEEDRPN